MCLVEIWREMCDFCRRSECDPLSGVQAGVYGGRCDGERVREGLGWGSQQHSGEDSPGWWQGILPYGGSLVSSFHSNSYKKKNPNIIVAAEIWLYLHWSTKTQAI